MRTKRSKDTQLVDKFNKQRDSLAAESKTYGAVKPAAADEDFTHSAGSEDDDLKARNSHSALLS